MIDKITRLAPNQSSISPVHHLPPNNMGVMPRRSGGGLLLAAHPDDPQQAARPCAFIGQPIPPVVLRSCHGGPITFILDNAARQVPADRGPPTAAF